MSGSRSSPPLKAWLFALGIALLILLPLFVPVPILEPAEGVNEHSYRHHVARFLGAESGVRNGPRGVMLAMSGGSCATVGPLRLSAGGVDMRVVYYADADVASFSGLVDVLLEGSPDFLVIQDTVVAMERSFDPLRETYWDVRQTWILLLRGLAQQLRARDGVEANDDSWRCPGRLRDRLDWAALIEDRRVRINPHSEQQRRDVLDFIGVFSEVGIPVLIVSAPANSSTAEYSLRIHELAKKYAHSDSPASTVSFHRQDTLMPTRLFNNPFHLSPAENQPFRDWLNTEVIQVIEGRSHK